MNAVETAVSARAEKGSGHHFPRAESSTSLISAFRISAFQFYPTTLLNPANDSVTRLSSLFLMNLAFPSRYCA